MNKIRNKMKKQCGFTLIEMLIVVAIIAILVAVSIPLVNSSLERTRKATDAANERAAKAEATIQYLSESLPGQDPTAPDEIPCYYDAASGKIVQNYGDVAITYGKCKGHKDGIIKIVVKDTGEIELNWVNKTDGSNLSEGAHNASVD